MDNKSIRSDQIKSLLPVGLTHDISALPHPSPPPSSSADFPSLRTPLSAGSARGPPWSSAPGWPPSQRAAPIPLDP